MYIHTWRCRDVSNVEPSRWPMPAAEMRVPPVRRACSLDSLATSSSVSSVTCRQSRHLRLSRCATT